LENSISYFNLSLINLPIFFLIGKVFFKNLEGLLTSIHFLITPDLLSAIRGEFLDDWWESLRFIIFIFVCVLLILSEKAFIEKYMG